MLTRLSEQLRALWRWFFDQWRTNPLGSLVVTVILVVLAAIVIETVRQGNTGFARKTLWDWLELLLVPVALALGGSLFGIYLTRTVEARQKRDDLTVEIYNQYLVRYREFGRVRHLLADSQESELSAADRNAIRDFGNWLDLVATLANREMLNTTLLAEWQLDDTICTFYDDTARFDFLETTRAGDAWRNMRHYCTGRTSDGP